MERRIAPSTRIEEAIEEVLLTGFGDPDRLTELGRLGTQLVLQRAVEEEVTAFLGRARYERTPEAHRLTQRHPAPPGPDRRGRDRRGHAPGA